MVLIWFFNRKNKKKYQRKLDYAILLKKIYDKQNFIVKYHIKKANTIGDSILYPKKEETKSFSIRLKQCFGEEFDKFPGSYNSFANVSHGNPNFDPYPIEKLKVFHDKIEEKFPEPFKNEVYIELELDIKQILKYTGYPIFYTSKISKL